MESLAKKYVNFLRRHLGLSTGDPVPGLLWGPTLVIVGNTNHQEEVVLVDVRC